MMTLLLSMLLAVADTGSISGRVVDGAGEPVADAAVCILDAESGIPVRRATWRPFPERADDIEDAVADIAFVMTDDEGSFSLEDIPAGRYRLLAQSWIGQPDPAGVVDVNSKIVHVRGVAVIDLEAAEHEEVEIRPLGNATLIMGDHAPNDGTLVVVSTEPPRADPILAFAGWSGPFMQHMIAANRMPDGVTTFRGLPEGQVHLTIFSTDNVPAAGAASVTLDDDRPMWISIPFVAAWSDGVHEPPPHLEELTNRIENLPMEDLVRLREQMMPPARADGGSLSAVIAAAARQLDEPFTLPDGATVRGADLMAAMGYASLRIQLETTGRTPNPYRAAEIRPVHPNPDRPEHMSGNPIVPGWYADPEGVVFNETYWIFPTYSAPYDSQLHFDAFSSPDLVAWTKHDRILTADDVAWAHRAMWAPAAIERDGNYFLFFSANDIQSNDEVGGIGVAVADAPAGPYRDHIGRPLVDRFHHGAQPIDQFVFRDNDGSDYLIYGGWRHCNIARLRDDYRALLPFDDGQVFKEITPAGYVEGPFMFVRDGRYYFMWSEGGWTGPDYRVAYAVADSVMGPWQRVGTILEQDPDVATGAGHHSVVRGPGPDDWYIVYHRRPLGETDRNHRVICIDRMTFDDDGFIEPVTITFDGVEAAPF